MNIMNAYRFEASRQQHRVFCKILQLLPRLLLVIIIYLIFGLLFQFADAEQSVDPYQSGHGSIWLLSADGIYLEALQMHTDVNFTVTGSIARARVKQQFTNDSAIWSEGIYVFPLPENAAVDHFTMRVGERIIEGQVRERQLAKKGYEAAKASGRKTSLVEQQRPNVFTSSVANIAPGETISIEFEYQQLLEYRDGSYRLRYPMVVGPRYHPPAGLALSGQQHADTDRNTSTSNTTSVSTQTDMRSNTHNPTRIHVQLDAGVSLASLSSSYHEIDIKQTAETRYSISTAGEKIISDRDFELIWQPALTDQPQLSVFTEQLADKHYTLVTLLPPDLSYLQEKIPARDVIFVLDISGSMSGTSIEQAKASLLTALDGLSGLDRFNIIWFNDQTGSLFPDVVNASAHYKNFARSSISSLQADGGTEMLPALKLALSNQEKFSRLRQVIFLTDGNISNETALFEVIDQQLGDSRLFTVGIGSAPNSYFMRKAAGRGRGSFTYIGEQSEVKEKTAALLRKLEKPALINIQLSAEPALPAQQERFEIFPSTIPDLYAGEPLSLLLRGDHIPQNISLRGDYGNSEWHSTTSLRAVSQPGISTAWAGEKIAALMDLYHRSSSDSERQQIRQQVVDNALHHHLVSRFTSMLAVDITPANDSGMLYRQQLKNNLPHGWKKSSPADQLVPAAEMIVAGLQLPQTANSTYFNLLLAAILSVSALLLYRWRSIKT